MLISASQLLDKPVMSLQTGKELARTNFTIINPHNLSVIAYRASGPLLDKKLSYLKISDIREIGTMGFIIDSSDEFIEFDDIINDKAVFEMQFVLNGLHVVDESRHKLGKVIDYVLDIDSFIIEQLIVRRPILKSLRDDELIIHRGQIIEITDDLIVIKSGKIKDGTKIQKSRHYVNPFRNTAPQPETFQSEKNK